MTNKITTSVPWRSDTEAPCDAGDPPRDVARDPGRNFDRDADGDADGNPDRNIALDGAWAVQRQMQASRERTVAQVRLLWSARRFIFRCVVLGLLLSVLIAFLIPSRFMSTTRLMPPDQASSSMAMLASAASGKQSAGIGAFAGDLLGLKTSGALFVGILQGRTVRDDLIRAFDLRKVYGASRWETARDELGQNTRISEDSKSGIITIAVTDHSPQRAAALAQEYVQELDRLMTAVNTTSAHRERVFLGERLAQVQTDLEAAEKGFSEFASQNSAIDIQAQSKALIDTSATLEGELIGAQTELEGLKQVYAEGNVHVRATRAKVEELQRQLDKVGGTASGNTDHKTGGQTGGKTGEVPQGASGAPPQDDPSAYPSLRKLPLLGVHYADLFRATKVQETIYEKLTEQYELAKVEEAKETPSVKVIDLPEVPEKKSSPHRLWIALLGTVACFLLSAIWTLGGDHWRRIDPRDSGKVLTLEMLASVKARWPFQRTSGRGTA